MARGADVDTVTQSSNPSPSPTRPSGPTNLSPMIWNPAHTARTTAPLSTALCRARLSFSLAAARPWGRSSPPPIT
jgi:hypothetical protein